MHNIRSTTLPEAPPMLPQTDTTTSIELITMSDEELEKPYKVIIENDDVTPMDFVVAILSVFFGLGVMAAQHVMLEAHYEGEAYVATFSFAEAQERVYAAHSAAREAGYPLTFHLEPDD